MNKTENKKQRPDVGDKLFALNVGNAARRRVQELTPVIVTKVGRKYFTVEGVNSFFLPTQFHIDGWKQVSDYSADYALYSTEQEWIDEREGQEIGAQIAKRFYYFRFNNDRISIKALRAIQSIINLEDSGC